MVAITFSGPDAFKFLNLTPKATAVLQRSPFLLAAVFLTLSGLMGMILIGYIIHYETSKPYRKLKPAAGKK